jgi:predicted enzyme related to lactoylglutathione lyase
VSAQTTKSSTAIVGIDLAGAVVPDLERSLAFYCDTLGMTPAYVADGGAEFHFPDGSTFGLWQPPAEEGAEHHFGVMFAVRDIRAAVKEFNRAGAALDEEIAESPVCYMAFGKDPEGNSIIIHQRKTVDEHRPPAGPRTATSINGVDLTGYLVEDPKRAMAFYRDALELVPTDVDEQGRGAEFTLADGSTFGVWHMPDGQKSGFVMFAVDDVRAKVDELRAKGYAISDVMDGPNCAMAFGPDPNGHAVIMHQRK